MSTLQVANVHLESTGNNRIQYTGSNTVEMYAGGNSVLTLASTGATINGMIPVGTTDTQTITNKSIDASQLTGDVAAARITTALNATGSAPIYACRAWVSHGATGTILASGNVSGVSGGPDIFTITFATALPTANFALSGSNDNSGYGIPYISARSTTSVTVNWGNRGTAGGGGASWNSIMVFA